jgi:hypothetical protein
LVLCLACVLLGSAPIFAAPYGKLRGVVLDSSGTPQLGASVTIAAEGARDANTIRLLTNDRGIFSHDALLPGEYSVRVALAGFLPAVQRGVRVEPNLTTILRIELGSVFTSLERLRRQPSRQADADEWKWVLRASTETRPILRYAANELGGRTGARSPARGRVELTSGARRPGSPSNLADAPSSAFAYEQQIGATGRLVVAGQASYERATAASFATTWLPAGDAARGPQTSLVLRRAALGPGGPVFRGARFDHSSQVMIGERWLLRYGTEFILVGLGSGHSSLRPRGELAMLLGPNWKATLTVAPRPLSTFELPESPLQATLNSMDAFPAVMLRNGRPVLESGWHQELALERQWGRQTRLVASVFRDTSSHTAVFGRGSATGSEVLQDYFSNGFAYDGGASTSWGTRIVYQQRFGREIETTFIYAYAGALAPTETDVREELRDRLQNRQRHSLAARIHGRVPCAGTTVTASYKWVSGTAVTRVDGYGEAYYQMDPTLNVTVRQPLPRVFSLPGRMEALADFRNLLAQGYVPVKTPEGTVLLMPTYRTIRGGLSFQF